MQSEIVHWVTTAPNPLSLEKESADEASRWDRLLEAVTVYEEWADGHGRPIDGTRLYDEMADAARLCREIVAQCQS